MIAAPLSPTGRASRTLNNATIKKAAFLYIELCCTVSLYIIVHYIAINASALNFSPMHWITPNWRCIVLLGLIFEKHYGSSANSVRRRRLSKRWKRVLLTLRLIFASLGRFWVGFNKFQLLTHRICLQCWPDVGSLVRFRVDFKSFNRHWIFVQFFAAPVAPTCRPVNLHNGKI